MGSTPMRGRAASEDALITAAADLFAEVGPNAVSVRNIADQAGVNHGLVHHYFGSKAGLVQAVLERMASESEAAMVEMGPAAVFDANDPRVRRHVRIVARVVLDNAAPPGFQNAFPVFDQIVGMIRNVTGVDDETARTRAASALAMSMGWLILEPFLIAAAGFDEDDRSRLLGELRLALGRVVNPG